MHTSLPQSTPLFFHGREGTNRGRKARWLATEYGACTPSYKTATLEDALPRARRFITQHRPSAIIGSSFGGAVLLAMIQEGYWSGPSVFLAQAGVKFGLQPQLPEGLPAVLIHGTRDDIVDLEDSRLLAESNGSTLHEIDDDHRLGSIRESGLLASALDSFGIHRLMTNKEFFPHPREPRVQWLDAFISPETSLEKRASLGQNSLMFGVELRLALMAALRGIWRDPQNANDVKNRMVIWELIQRTGGRRSRRQMAPFGLRVQGRDDQGVLHQGKIETTYGSSLYDYHYEWPIKGMGVRKDKIKVLHDGVETPIFEWLREKEITVFCYHCGGILSDRSERGCPGRGL
jgi:hypothetical protein